MAQGCQAKGTIAEQSPVIIGKKALSIIAHEARAAQHGDSVTPRRSRSSQLRKTSPHSHCGKNATVQLASNCSNYSKTAQQDQLKQAARRCAVSCRPAAVERGSSWYSGQYADRLHCTGTVSAACMPRAQSTALIHSELQREHTRAAAARGSSCSADGAGSSVARATTLNFSISAHGAPSCQIQFRSCT